jgi:hypothetical protein
MKCEYCGSDKSIDETLVRYGRLVCRDIAACDRAEAAAHRSALSELRDRRAAGDELTDGEKAELAA